VFNVAYPVLKACYPDQPAFRLFEVHTNEQSDESIIPIGERRHGSRRSTDSGPANLHAAEENPSPS
jgi:hypothetical protein